MNTPHSVDQLFALYELKGGQYYGESVTQTEHGLQCAALARRDGAPNALVVAALFHDVGHLVADAHGRGRFNLDVDDDDHEALGARVLSPILGHAVAQSVALHVTAKRWRCTIDRSYHTQLSPASQVTLRAQGGLLSLEECARFEAHPGFESALALRSWDDDAKTPDLHVGELRDYEVLVRALAAAR